MKVTTRFEPAISAANFESMLAFYRDVLGMTVFSIEEMPAERAAFAHISGTAYRLARLETEGHDRLKIVAALQSPKLQPDVSHLLERHGFAYLTFIVPDLRAVMGRLKKAGARLLTGPDPVPFRPGVVELAIAQDPEGNFLEFVERNDLASYRPCETTSSSVPPNASS